MFVERANAKGACVGYGISSMLVLYLGTAQALLPSFCALNATTTSCAAEHMFTTRDICL